ncbi:MAG: UDP-N-acetylglucosamine 1-carboxyvinyltransferase [Sphaerochaeta sp.]|jgi:UDP-N-acetylglucosamine 1-carboxyvinyltransferase
MTPIHIKAHIKGKQVPNGKVVISGAKNSATCLLAAALISDEEVKLANFPCFLVDALHQIDFIRQSGGIIKLDTLNECLSIDSTQYRIRPLLNFDFPIRITYLLAAGMLKRSKIAKIPYPGGCRIGARGYDLHIMVWERFGADVKELGDCLQIQAPNGLKPGIIDFPFLTVGGTENALITASIIEGTTTIRNPYITPEINELILFLRSMGIIIVVYKNNEIKVTGKSFIKGASFSIMPDRIEALTWLVFSVISGGSVHIENVPFSSMEIPLLHLKHIGIDYLSNNDSILILPKRISSNNLRPFEVACGTHPGIISDMQPLFTLLALGINGLSFVHDYRYPERVKYCEQLEKFYPNCLRWNPGRIEIRGGITPQASDVESTDLRGSIVLGLAALLAEGESTVEHFEMALRGYNNFQDKLAKLGINIDYENLI